jgi:hypothetical protein
MNAERTRQANHSRALAQHAATARLVPTASAVPDRTIDEWVERELQHGRCRVRAGLAILACIAVVAIPLLVWL